VNLIRNLLGVSAFVLITAFILTADVHGTKLKMSERRSPIAAPIHYAGVAIVLADKTGVAVVTFHCPPTDKHVLPATSEVVEYRYRYRGQDGTETTGQGLLFENFQSARDDDDVVVDAGGRVLLHAGHFQLELSQGDKSQGWLYYMPEELRMQFASSKSFEKLKLGRFTQ